MTRRGFTGTGTQRWYCRQCGITAIRTRPDNQVRSNAKLLGRWMAGLEALSGIAERKHRSREHLSRTLAPLWHDAPQPPVLEAYDDVLVLDAVGCGDGVAFILRTVDRPQATWDFGTTEDAEGWYAALARVDGAPRANVSDHQKGLRLAVKWRFPGVPHQRCQAHIVRQALVWITQRPKTLAGRTLRVLVLRLSRVGTEAEARQWSATLERWHAHFKNFLAEKTEGPNGRTWYTHRYLRKAVSLLLGCVSEAFTFTIASKVPKTSNHVEGGLNAQIAEHLHRHRGLPSERQKAMLAFFLADWNQRNSRTRNIT